MLFVVTYVIKARSLNDGQYALVNKRLDETFEAMLDMAEDTKKQKSKLPCDEKGWHPDTVGCAGCKFEKNGCAQLKK